MTMARDASAAEVLPRTATIEPTGLGLRERKRLRLRREIVDASLELFHTRGYESTRVVDIVEELEISQPTFFRYFPSKAAVLYEAASMALEEPLEVVPQLRGRASTSAAFLMSLVHVYADVITKNADLARLIARHGGADTFKSFICPNADDPEDRVEHRDGKFHQQMQLPYLQQALEAGQRTGEFSSELDLELLRPMLWSLLLSVVTDWASPEAPPYDLHERLESAVDIFVNGCRPRSNAA